MMVSNQLEDGSYQYFFEKVIIRLPWSRKSNTPEDMVVHNESLLLASCETRRCESLLLVKKLHEIKVKFKKKTPLIHIIPSDGVLL